ncbi:MAG TPA: C25 family cysteine peptidase [Anaerolineales bacterium]|nr:C25 family cysteine peptidase [Anaerolineales bacterium]
MISSRRIMLWLVLTASLGTSGLRFTPPSAVGRFDPIVETRQGEVVLEWLAPEPRLVTLAGGESRIEMEGFPMLEQPGAPQVPFASALLALPLGSDPSLQILELEEDSMALPGGLAAAPEPQGIFRSPEGQALGGAFKPASQAIWLPVEPISMEVLGSLRGVRLARLTFYPARPEDKLLRLARRVKVSVRFDSSMTSAGPAASHADPILAAIRSAVVNPEQVYLVEPQSGAGQLSRPADPLAELAIRPAAIEVAEPGLVSLTYTSLQQAGFQTRGVDPNRLRLEHAGVEIPFEWEGDEDTTFEPGERLLFYAEPRFSRYSRVDVFFLKLGKTPAALIPERSADPTSLPSGIPWVDQLVEKNLLYTPNCYCAPIPSGRDGDRWVWDDLQLPSNPQATYPVDLPDLDPAQPARLSLWLLGYTDPPTAPDHRVLVAFNGAPVGTLEWDGKQAVSGEFELPSSALQPGENSLSLELPGAPGVEVEGLWLDAFLMRYARSAAPFGEHLAFSGEENPHAYTLALASFNGLRAYEVTDPLQPVRLIDLQTGSQNQLTLGDPTEGGARRYWITSESGIAAPERIRLAAELRSDAWRNGADYLMIAPAEFISAVTGLAELRQSFGLQTVIEDVQAIYDVYGDGRTSPEALRAFLVEAYASWEPRPAYLVLVGDGTSDPKSYLPSSSQTFIPPYLAEVDPWAGETAADNRYVTLEGEDNLPEMLVSRLPVNSQAEARTVAQKIIGYETSPAPGIWNRTGILVADDQDDGGNFPGQSDALLSELQALGLAPVRLYHLPPENNGAEIHQSLLENWNAGAGLVMYTGHASIHQWAAEQFLHLEDIPNLQNGVRLPLVLEMTCFTGSFQVPGFPTLDESLLRSAEGGAIAVWGPTGLGIATGHEALAEGFLRSLAQDQADLGTAALAGKLNLLKRAPVFADLVDTFTLFGDAFTRLALQPGDEINFLPLIQQ